jgi:hypothetical protein
MKCSKKSPFKSIDEKKMKVAMKMLGIKCNDKVEALEEIAKAVNAIKPNSTQEQRLQKVEADWNSLCDVYDAYYAIKDDIKEVVEDAKPLKSSGKGKKEPMKAARKEVVEPDNSKKKSKTAKKPAKETPKPAPAKKKNGRVEQVEVNEKKKKASGEVNWQDKREAHIASMKKRFKDTGNPWVEGTGCHVFFNLAKKCKSIDKAKDLFREWAKKEKYDGNVEGRIAIVLTQAKQIKAL